MTDASIGGNVRAEIARRFLTQKQVAHHLGISQQNMSQRIRGHVRFREAELKLLSELLEVPVDTLTKGQRR